jgi:hypothetical protein
MGKHLDNETIQAMREMYEDGNSYKTVAEKFGVGTSTVWFYISEKASRFKTYKEYQTHLTAQKGPESYEPIDITQEDSRIRTREDRERFAKERGFESHIAYLNHWAEEHGYDSYAHYQQVLREKRGVEHKLIRMKQERSRKKRSRNKNLSGFLKGRLKELGETRNWLARELGVTRQMISNVILRKNSFGEENLSKLCEVVGVSRNRLEKILSQ